MAVVGIIIFIIIGYLCGSIPSAVMLSKIMGFPDPREVGSQNPGATNVLRVAGKTPGILVLLLDALKGFVPLAILLMIGFGHDDVSWAGLGAVIGHMYPCYLGFKGGGKGVATGLGIMLGISYVLGLLVAATWVGVAFVFRYASVSSMVAVSAAPFFSLFVLGDINIFIPLCIIAALVIFQHRGNISRLIEGQEPEIQFFKNK